MLAVLERPERSQTHKRAVRASSPLRLGLFIGGPLTALVYGWRDVGAQAGGGA